MELDFPGYAIGGLSVGGTKEDMYRILDLTHHLLPEEKPRYLMGVGALKIRWKELKGVDMFDCVPLPDWPATVPLILKRQNYRKECHLCRKILLPLIVNATVMSAKIIRGLILGI